MRIGQIDGRQLGPTRLGDIEERREGAFLQTASLTYMEIITTNVIVFV